MTEDDAEDISLLPGRTSSLPYIRDDTASSKTSTVQAKVVLLLLVWGTSQVLLALSIIALPKTVADSHPLVEPPMLLSDHFNRRHPSHR